MEIIPEYLTPIVDRQFEMLNIGMRFSDIPEDGVIEVGGKRDYWYNIHKFTAEQEQEWMEWAYEELKRKAAEEDFEYMNLRYGIVRRYKKEGELF
jgi:disulfide oxidoreductase YuzD